jgi:predicted N-formylglutamate amidohydrolase
MRGAWESWPQGAFCISGRFDTMLYSPNAMQQRAEASAQAAAGGAWRSFGIVRGAAATSVIIICDHATNLVPPEYALLGLDDIQLNRHIGYDIGALEVALELGRRLEATVISSRFSRLLIDPNRGEDDPTLIMQISDGAIVPGNAVLGAAERAKRIAEFHAPYHAAIAAELDAMLSRGLVPAVVSIHSFTEAWRGVPRKWHAALLWDQDPRLTVPLLRELRTRTGVEIGDNEPYSGHLRNDSIFRHATLRGLPNALIEIRQDQIREAKGQHEWGALIADSLTAIFADPVNASSLSRVDFCGSKTDMKVEI